MIFAEALAEAPQPSEQADGLSIGSRMADIA